MRPVERIAGVFFILFGLGFLAATVYLGTYQESVVAPTPRDLRLVIGGIIVGLGFCAAGVYIFRAEASQRSIRGFRPFLAAHVRELRVVAYLGCALSLIRLAAICFYIDWPGRWSELPLTL